MANIDLTKCWTTGAPPQAMPLEEDITKYGSLIAFQKHAIRFIEQWLPLAPIVNQDRANVITYADKKTVVSDVSKTLQTIGLSMVVGLESAKKTSALIHAITFDPFTFAVNIAENPITNRGSRGSGMTASAVAENVMMCFAGTLLGNKSCSIVSFVTGGEEGTLQTAEVKISTAYTIMPPASLLAE